MNSDVAMNNNVNAAIQSQANDWVIRQRDPEFSDWDAFTDWLEQHPDHLAIYDATASMDFDIGGLPVPARGSSGVPVEPPKRFVSGRRGWLGGVLAASIVGMIGYALIDVNSNGTRIETVAGEHRTLNLADGSRIEINGATVLELDSDRPRFAKLERGEAMFYIVHRANEPFTVEAGTAKLVDLGTAFNVVRRSNGTSVAVSEGIIAYNPDRENVQVDVGKKLDVRDGVGRPQLHDIDIQSVGGWRTGQLVYSGTSLAEVANDLSRTTGMNIAVSSNVEELPFRGALLISKDRARTIDDLTALAGIHAEKTADGWLLTR